MQRGEGGGAALHAEPASRGELSKAPRALVELEEIEARRARRTAKTVKKRRRV